MKINLLLLFLLSFATNGFAQKPNPALRLPETADMPEWAKKLYVDDSNINVFELDKVFAPWHETYLSLKAEMIKVGEKASDELKQQYGLYKQYEKYYKRWRNEVYLFMNPDGSLDFSKETYKDFETAPAKANILTNSNWSYLGPISNYRIGTGAPKTFHANMYSLDIAPSNSDILYCGSETGVVNKTTDKGLNWTQVGADYFVGEGIDAVAIHPTNPDIVYVLHDRKIHTTTDGGTTWSVALASFNAGNDLKIKPDEPEVVLASGVTLQRRTAGNVWTNVLSKFSYDIAFKPNDPLIAYTLVINGPVTEFWKSTDGGLTWSVRSNGWPSLSGSGRMTVTPADNDRIYVVVLSAGGPRIMRSDDAGETWAVVASSNQTGSIGPCTEGALSMANGQGYFALSIVASHTNADHIIVGTTTSFKSTDGGFTYTTLGGYCGDFDIHPDIQEMMAKGGDTWIATDGGMNLSTDFYTSTANHTVRTNNLRGVEYWSFDQGWNEDVVVGGRYHNGNSVGRESYPAGIHLGVGGGEAPTGYINPGNPSMIYFSDLGSTGSGRILSPDITGIPQNFIVSKFPNEAYLHMMGGEQKWDPRYMYTYYLGEGNKFWKTTDNGISFTALYTHSQSNALVRYIEVSRSNPDVIYFTVQLSGPADVQLWKTTDGGATWAQCSNPGTLTATQRNASKITMSGTDANTLWWAFNNGPNTQKVFKSIDGGATWINWTTSTLNSLKATDILHQLGTDGGVYFITGNGGKVFYRDNTASDWTVYNTDLPLNLYGDFGGVQAKAFYKGGKIRLAGGNGIWEADFFTPSTTTLVQPMTDHAEVNCLRDTIQLESYSVVNGAATYQWSLSPAPQWISNANIRNPRIVLGSAGVYAATLTVTDANGVTNRTVNNFINNLPLGNLCAPDTLPGKLLTLTNPGDYASQTEALNITTNTITLSCWIKPNGTQNALASIMLSSTTGGRCGLNFNGDGTRLGYQWRGGQTGWNGGPVVPSNEWSHVAMVVTAANTTVYLNGVPYTNNVANTATNFDQNFLFGETVSWPTRRFKGQMDEVCIYDRALSTDEIRELMNLTRNNPNAGSLPGNDPSLISYYQFNEGADKPAYDKVGGNHANLVGGAIKSETSTAPVGGGTFERINVTTGGVTDFAVPGVELNFPAAGTYPNGDLVVTRLNVPSDQQANIYVYPSSPKSYYVIRNYGTNSSFTALDGMKFKNVQGLNNSMVAQPDYIKLYKRLSNDDGDTWGSSIDDADVVTNNSGTGTVEFNTGLNVTNFSQFSMAAASPPLPVQLLSFTAQNMDNKKALLTWKVAQEVNLQGYQVERSDDGVNFVAIGFVAATGISKYIFNDATPKYGKNFYRIRMIDIDGRFKYSDIRNLEFKSDIVLTISPNPNHDGIISLMFAGLQKNEDISLSVSNATGKLIKTAYIKNIGNSSRVTTELGSTVPGVYYVRITLTSGQVFTEKLVLTGR